MSADSDLVAALRAQLARETAQREAAEAMAARETAQREAAEAMAARETAQREVAELRREAAEVTRDEAIAQAAAVTRQASLDASLALLATFALAVRSSQWQTQVLPKLTPLPFPERLLPELPPHVRDALAIAVRSINPLPDDAAETGEETPGTVHWLVRQLVDAAQSVLPPRWTVLHEPRCLGGDVAGADKKRRPDVPDWVLLDPVIPHHGELLPDSWRPKPLRGPTKARRRCLRRATLARRATRRRRSKHKSAPTQQSHWRWCVS